MSYLPEIKAQDTKTIIGIDVGIRGIFRVVNFRVYPSTLVIWVINLTRLPLALQRRTR